MYIKDFFYKFTSQLSSCPEQEHHAPEQEKNYIYIAYVTKSENLLLRGNYGFNQIKLAIMCAI